MRRLNVIMSGGHFLGVVLHAAALAELHRIAADNGWQIARVGGLSAGSLVAAAYCSGHDVPGLQQIVQQHMLPSGAARQGQPIAKPSYARLAAQIIDPDEDDWPALYRTGRIRQTIKTACARLLGDMHQARFRAVLCNMTNRHSDAGSKTIVDSERHPDIMTVDAVSASMAIPLAFPLVEHVNDDVFADGALAAGNTPYDLWADVDSHGVDTIILRIKRASHRKRPSFRPLGLIEDTIETMLASMDQLARKQMPGTALLIDLPATGPGAAFDMTQQEAASHMNAAREAVRLSERCQQFSVQAQLSDTLHQQGLM